MNAASSVPPRAHAALFSAFRAASAARVLLCTAVCLVACSKAPSSVDRGSSPLVDEFGFAAEQTGVPVDLLMAIGYVESRFDQRAGQPSRLYGYGVMHLRRGSTLERAASLSGLTRAQLEQHAGSNILGGARVLAAIARDRGARPDDLVGWRATLERYSGLERDAAADYAARVLSVLRRGATGSDDSGGTLRIPAHPDLDAGELPPGIGRRESALRPDYSGAKWLGPACCSSRRSGSTRYVVIHTCQGAFSGCWSWLKGCHNVSAHYVVSSGGKVVQLVEERLKAWHVGCLNSASVGIEHEGYISNPSKWFTDKMYCASAKLTASVCKRLKIPCDRKHVIGHVEANKLFCHGSHTDPGSGWNWTKYMRYVRNGCGAASYPQLTIEISAKTIEDQARDTCKVGKSDGIFDWKVGQKTEFLIDIKNRGKAVARDVTVGLWGEEPYVAIKRWSIYSDWKAGGSFKLNDTDAMQKVKRNDPGKSFELQLKSMSPGETKRIKLVVAARRFSIGAADHPDVRAWVSHIDDYYDKSSFATKPSKNVKGYQKQNGGDLRAYFQTDVLDIERCDGVDNDCDGETDEQCVAGDLAMANLDGGAVAATGDGELGIAEISGGCSCRSGAAADAGDPPLWLCLLLGLVALRKRSTKRPTNTGYRPERR